MFGKEGISDRNFVQASVPSKLSNWQRLFTRSTITVKKWHVSLQVCLPITPLLIHLLRNHGFWIAEQSITLHLFTIFHTHFIIISSTGTIKFNDKITFKDGLCVPSFNLNLMSVSKITSSLNCCVVFTPYGCVLQKLTRGGWLAWVKKHAGSYYMSPLPNQTHASQISTDPDLWHKCLGHPSPACLQLASSLLPIPFSKNLILIHNCSICPKAKQTRLPFSLSTIKSHSPFNLLHYDIWGPHKTPTHFGKTFFSHYSWWLYKMYLVISYESQV